MTISQDTHIELSDLEISAGRADIVAWQGLALAAHARGLRWLPPGPAYREIAAPQSTRPLDRE